MKCSVVNLDNESVGEIDLADEVFGVDVRKDILARMVTWQLAKRRQGTKQQKTRGEVAGTTKRIGRQKGAGRARHGARTAPIFRGGGATFAARPHGHAHDLTKKVRALALKSALSSKQAAGQIVVLDKAELAAPKTKDLAGRLAKLGVTSALVIGGEAVDNNFALAARNLPLVDVLPQQGANVYDILRRDVLVLTREAVEALEARLK